MTTELENSLLGKKTNYFQHYSPELLFPIARKIKRDEILIPLVLPFQGMDIWNAFELSWLNEKGKPQVAVGEFIIPCDSPTIVESKPLKLYLNSLNQSVFNSLTEVQALIQQDLSAATEAQVSVQLLPLALADKIALQTFDGVCLDELDIRCDTYQVAPELLVVEKDSSVVEEIFYSHLLKSNCLVTGQPDWGTVQIRYRGKKINPESLLRYIISYRDHPGFAEQCVERMFMDLTRMCKPEQLTVYGRYTRRGGLDINPYRSTDDYHCGNIRLYRQ